MASSTPVVRLTGSVLQAIDPVSMPPPDASAPTLGTGIIAMTPTFLAGSGGLNTVRSVVAATAASSSSGPGSGSADAYEDAPLVVGSSVEGFHCLGIRFSSAAAGSGGGSGSGAPPPVGSTVHALTALALDTATGRLTASYGVTMAATGMPLCSVAHTVTPLRHAPAFVLHRLQVTVDASLQDGFSVYHDLRADAQLSGVRYSGESIHASATGAPISTLGASGYHGRTGCTVRALSAYRVLGSQEAVVAGFNILRDPTSPDIGYTRITFRQMSTSLVGGSHTYDIAIVTGHEAVSRGTTSGLPGGSPMLSRVLLSFFSRDMVPAGLQAASDAAWADAWFSDVQVEAKASLLAAPPGGGGGNPTELARINRVQRALRIAMYNLHAMSSSASASSDSALVDAWATLRKVGMTDVFFLPFLTLLLPAAAQSALNQRYDALAQARAFARLAGLRGALFSDAPCSVIGAGSSTCNVMLNGVGPLQIFISALVALNAWNYYRVTLDRDWLIARGFPMLRDVADMLVSTATLSPSSGDPNDAPAYNLLGVVGLDGSAAPAKDNALTVTATIMALRSATEAAYLLGYMPNAAWTAVRDGLTPPTFDASTSMPDVVMRDADTPVSEAALVLEPLLTLIPSMTGGTYLPAAAYTHNLQYWSANTAPAAIMPTSQAFTADGVLPVNVALVALVQGLVCQTVSSGSAAAEADKFDAALHAFLDTCSDDNGWGNLSGIGRTGVGLAPNDVTLSCALLLVLLHGIAVATVTGGVSESRFIYAPMGVSIAPMGVMPPGWARVWVSGLGRNRGNYDVVNQLLLGNGGGGGGVGGGGVGGSGSTYVPWSVDILSFK